MYRVQYDSTTLLFSGDLSVLLHTKAIHKHTPSSANSCAPIHILQPTAGIGAAPRPRLLCAAATSKEAAEPQLGDERIARSPAGRSFFLHAIAKKKPLHSGLRKGRCETTKKSKYIYVCHASLLFSHIDECSTHTAAIPTPYGPEDSLYIALRSHARTEPQCCDI